MSVAHFTCSYRPWGKCSNCFLSHEHEINCDIEHQTCLHVCEFFYWMIEYMEASVFILLHVRLSFEWRDQQLGSCSYGNQVTFEQCTLVTEVILVILDVLYIYTHCIYTVYTPCFDLCPPYVSQPCLDKPCTEVEVWGGVPATIVCPEKAPSEGWCSNIVVWV